MQSHPPRLGSEDPARSRGLGPKPAGAAPPGGLGPARQVVARPGRGATGLVRLRLLLGPGWDPPHVLTGAGGGYSRAMAEDARPPVPPFDETTALLKVQAAEDGWNSRDPQRVALAYTEDSVWRNRDLFLTGRAGIVTFLTAKWERELDYVLRKSLWAFHGNRIAVRFQYEWHDAAGQWFRSHGNENWEFADNGLMRRREASINDVAIAESDRRLHGPRPDTERGPGHEIPLR